MSNNDNDNDQDIFSDMYLIKVQLQQWGLEAYFENFKDGGYDSLEVFYNLIKPDFKTELAALIPTPGHRIKFLTKLAAQNKALETECRALSDSISENDGLENIKSPGTSSNNTSDLDVHNQSTGILSLHTDNNLNTSHDASVSGFPTQTPNNTRKRLLDNEATSDSSPPKRAAIPCEEIQGILRLSGTGRCVLALAKKVEALVDKDQDRIARVLVEHELGQKENFRISKERFHNLAGQIVSLFPEESEDIFYVPYKSVNGKRYLAKGKLISQYQRLRKELGKVGLIETDNDGLNGIPQEIPSADGMKKLKYLEKEVDNWDVIKQYWTETADIRIKRLQNSSGGTVAEYFQTYPALKEKLGYELLEIDFKHLYPAHNLNAFVNWEAFLNAAESALRNHEPKSPQLVDSIVLLDDESTIPGTRELIILLSLGYLDTVVTVAKKKRPNTNSATGECSKSTTWRPPHVEIQEGFMSQISSVGKIEKFVQDRTNKLYSWNVKVQPYVLICGSSVEDVHASYVVIDKVKYLMSSPQKALDICFKAIHATHASYSKESHRLWMLIQKKLYELNTVFDGDVKDSQLPGLLRKFK